jgi:hypothetical protein
VRSQAASSARRAKTRKAPTAKVIPLHPAPTTQNPTSDLINSWTPNDKAVAAVWIQIAPAVRAHLLAANLGGPEIARKYIRALARHAAIRHKAGHTISDAADLFSDLAFVSTFGKDVASGIGPEAKRMALAYMRRLRALLLPTIYATPNSLVIGAKQIATPYSDADLARLLAFARERSAVRNIRIHGALLLALAAGLDGHEISKVCGSDLIATPWGLVITAPGLPGKSGRPKRLVPVLAAFEDELAHLAVAAERDPFIGTKDSIELRAASEMQPNKAGVPHFKASRARANWTRTLLKGGATYVAMRDAGVSVASDRVLFVLSKDLTIPFDQYVTQLRMGEKTFDYASYSHLPQYQGGQQ